MRWHCLCSASLSLSLMPWIDIKDPPTDDEAICTPPHPPHTVCLSWPLSTLTSKLFLFELRVSTASDGPLQTLSLFFLKFVCLLLLGCLNKWWSTFTSQHHGSLITHGATTGWGDVCLYSNQLDYMIYSRCPFDGWPAALVSSLADGPFFFVFICSSECRVLCQLSCSVVLHPDVRRSSRAQVINPLNSTSQNCFPVSFKCQRCAPDIQRRCVYFCWYWSTLMRLHTSTCPKERLSCTLLFIENTFHPSVFDQGKACINSSTSRI